MKISFTLVSVLAGLVMASPVPQAATNAADSPIQAQALDGACVSCVSRKCGAAGIRCLGRIHPIAIVSCLALTCGDDIFKCCVF